MIAPLAFVTVASILAGAGEPERLPSDAPIMASLAVGGSTVVDQASEQATQCVPSVPCFPASGGRTALLGAGATSLMLATATLGVIAGWLLPSWYFNRYGRPDPFVFGAGLGLGFALGVGSSQWLVPLASPLGDDAWYRGSIAEARRAGWERSRWAVLAGAVGLATYTVGAGLESRDFGSGQALIGLGGTTVILSGLAYLGLEVTGVVNGYQHSRRPRDR